MATIPSVCILQLCLMVCISLNVAQQTTLTYKGDSTTVRCPLQNATFPNWYGPPAFFTYYQGGLRQFNPNLPESKKRRLSIATDDSSLAIANTTLGDAGEYKCVNSLKESTTDVIVRVRASEPDITSSVQIDSSGLRATEGQRLTVTCTSRGGYPVPTVGWYKGSNAQALVQTSSGTAAADSTFTVTLDYTFIPTRQDDRQQLECRSYWPTEVQDLRQKSVSLYLNLKPNQPSVTQIAPVVTGDDIEMECRTTGSRPAANISWVFRDETVTGVTRVMQDISTHTFTIVSVLERRVTSADNGKPLTCKVTHLTGELTNTSTMNIQFAAPSRSTKISGNRTIVANGVNQLSLTCTTGSSNPVSVITWKKGNIVINGNSQPTDMRGENNGVIRSQVLTLRPTRDDNGEIVTCSTSNGVSTVTDTASVTLDMHYSPLINTMTDQTVVEGNIAVFKCTAGSKPVSYFKWTFGSVPVAQGNGTASYNGLNHNITAVSRSHAGKYTCTADNEIPPHDTRQTRLVVQYPPDVVVTAFNTTVQSESATLTCGASGVPDQYTYEGWVHKFNGVNVSYPEPLPASKELTLTGLSYAHSGVYRCGASNGVGRVVSHGENTILVQSFPIFIGDIASSKEIKAPGQLMKPTVITFQYYSNAGNSSVKVLKVNGTGEEVGEIRDRSVVVKLPVFLSEITTPGTEVTINITVTTESQFGEYQIIVKNRIDQVNLSLFIQPLGRPETPTFVNSTVLDHNSVIISWISGFPNGLNQTFVIQISTDNSTWQNTTHYGGMSFKQTHTQRVNDLASSRLYFWRMLAMNSAGESQPTGIFKFGTPAPPDSTTSLPTGLIVGGAVGGAVAAMLVIAVIIFIVWRRSSTRLSGKAKDNRTNVISSNHNLGYDDGDEEVENRLYVTAGPRETETAVGFSTGMQEIPSGGRNIYAKVNKNSEVVYAMPNKQKELYAVPDKSKGDVYENAPSTLFGNRSTPKPGENVNEDTSTTTSAVPKKPTGRDGLLYADLEFAPRKKGPTKIIGIEDRCEYTTIDLTKKAQPLPDSDDEDKTNT